MTGSWHRSSGILRQVFLMRWLLLVLLISLLGLLFAALSLARFIWRQRVRRDAKPLPRTTHVSPETGKDDVETEL